MTRRCGEGEREGVEQQWVNIAATSVKGTFIPSVPLSLLLVIPSHTH